MRRKVPPPHTLVIFGASGDLTHRKLIPSLYSLFRQELLPEEVSILGFARSDIGDEAFRDQLRRAVAGSSKAPDVDEETWGRFADRLHYLNGQYDRGEDFRRLKERLDQLAQRQGRAGNCLFYLATPPNVFPTITERLAEVGLARRGSASEPWSRIIIEKPFGYDLSSACRLNRQMRESFDEGQIFRIDHYLGKETVQNLLVLRFANAIFEPIWHQKYVDHVQMTVAETLGVAGRGGYYDGAGAIRDMVQNHMLHLLSLVAMEPPVSLEADAIRDEKVKVVRALRPIPEHCAVNGVVQAQYAPGRVDGQDVAGYRQEEGVDERSGTPTFVAFKTFVDNWRWAGVPFYLRTGKRLAERLTEISIHFRAIPQVLFNLPPTGPMKPNVLVVRIQPDEGISLQFQVKAPGPAMRIEPLRMDFSYHGAFGTSPPEAYERLILDAALGDATLFTRSDEVEAAWAFVQPVIAGCSMQDPDRLATYGPGSWGPDEASDLIEADGNHWRSGQG